MGISGLIGAGVQESLDDLIAQQLLQAQQMERERSARASEGIAAERNVIGREQLAQRGREATDEAAYRQKMLDETAATRRDQNNVRGIEMMLRERAAMDGPAVEYTTPQRVMGPNGREIVRIFRKDDPELQRGVPVRSESGTPERERVVPVETVGADGTPETRYLPESQVVGQTFKKPTTQASGGLAAQQAATRAQRAAAALNSIETLKGLAPQRVEGPLGMAQGALETVKGYAGYNSDVRQYQALLGPTAMQMAVAVQGAANLSDTERETMKQMLGTIGTMDYQTQMALLDNAARLISDGGDVQKVTAEGRERWVARPRGAVAIPPRPQPAPAEAAPPQGDAPRQRIEIQRGPDGRLILPR